MRLLPETPAPARRSPAVLLALLLLAVTSLTSVTPVPAAEAAPVIVAPRYSPQTGAIFNNATGEPVEQFAILDHITRSIESAPPGSNIRIAVYSWSYTPMADAAIAAHRRGVNVKILIDSHTTTPEIQLLQKKLGRNKSARSFVATCKYGCMSSQASFMHAKIYMFSTAGSSKQVVMTSSGNPAFSAGTHSWNNIYTTVGDPVLYFSNMQYFNDMLKDRTNTSYYRTTSSGPYKAYFYPRAGKTSHSDTIWNVLNDVHCLIPASPGVGDGFGHTVVSLTAYTWTTARMDVAVKLSELRRAGCQVQIIYSQDTVDPKVTSQLVTKAGVATFNARLDIDNDKIMDLYVHSKYLLINGAVGTSKGLKVVYTGSPNFTGNSLRQNNENMLRIQIDAVYDQFLANFDYIRDAWAQPVNRPLTSAKTGPATSSGTGDEVGNAEGLATGNDYRVDPKEDAR
ncbi:MAG: hypothetical protein JWP61_138 [Friedmanniella sp.]|nr:hypothetical protein [Friedmanniella sp.]